MIAQADDRDDSETAGEEAAKAARLIRLTEIADVLAIMDDPRGRRVIYRLLSWCGVYHSSFSTCPLTMARNEGQRSIGLKLLAEISECAPHRVRDLYDEAHDSERKT